MATAGSIVVDLLMRTGSFFTDSKRAEKAMTQFEKTTRAAGKAMSVSFAAGAGLASAAALKYIQNTIEAERVQAQLASRILDTGAAANVSLGRLNEMADSLSKLTVFDDEAINGVQAMLLTFKDIKSDNFEAATGAVLDLSTAMGTDLNAASVQLGKALNDPLKGLTALAKAGVQFDDSQKKLIKSLVNVGDVSAAQRVILDELTGQMGTAAEAARNTFGGALQALSNSFDNLLEGDAGNGGLKGAREALEGLIETFNDPSTKAGIDSMISGLLRLSNAAIVGAREVGGFLADIKHTVTGFDSAGIKRQEEVVKSLRDSLAQKQKDFSEDTPFFGGRITALKKELQEAEAKLKAARVDFFTPDIDRQVREGLGIGRPAPSPRRSGALPDAGGDSKGSKSDVEKQAERLAKATREMTKVQREWQTELDDSGSPILEAYGERLDQITAMGERFTADGLDPARVKEFTAAMTVLADGLKSKELTEFQEQFARETEALAASIDGSVSPALAQYIALEGELAKVMKQGALTTELYEGRLKALAAQRNETADQMRKDYEFELVLLGKTREQQEQLNAARRLAADVATPEGEAALAALRARQDAERGMSDQIAAMDGLRDSTRGFFQDLKEGKGIWDSLTNAADNFADVLFDLAAKNVMEQILGPYGSGGGGAAGGGIGGLLGSFFGGGGSGGSGGGFLSSLFGGGKGAAPSAGFSSMFGSNTSWLFGGAMAGGGQTMANRAYLVGENGPEMFVPRGAGAVLPNEVTRNMIGGGRGDFTQVNNTYISGPTNRRTPQQIEQATGRAARRAMARNG